MKRLMLAAVLACAGCAHTEAMPDAKGAKTARANIDAKSGSSLSGVARFTTDGTRVTVVIQVTNAPAGKKLAVHLHEMADCSSPDAKSAGEHWNPQRSEHGQMEHSPFHLGDIGNIDVGADGSGSLKLTTDLWSLGTGQGNDVVDHALVVHADPDDFKSQPAGNSGDRIGCGVVKLDGTTAVVTMR